VRPQPIDTQPIEINVRKPYMEYDAVIVGARVAGASLALLLGQGGRRVLLIDRDRFPSDTLSTHVLGPQAVPLLDQLGILADVEAAGFRRMTRTRTYIDDCAFEGPCAPAGGYGLAPRRDRLDSILIEHAVRRGGAELWTETSVTGLLWEGERVVGVRATTAAGEEREVRAKVVVGADGRYSKVAGWVGAATYEEVPPLRAGYYGYYHGVTPLPEPALELFFVRGQLAFVFPMRPNEDCLALEIPSDEFEAFRANPTASFEERLRSLPGMAQRMQGARLEGKLMGTRGVENHLRVPYGPGWVLTGDAAYLKDPSTGLGIGDAFTQSFLLASALESIFGGADWDATLRDFQRKRDEIVLPAYHATIEHTRMPDPPPDALAWLRALLSAPPFVRHLAASLPGASAQVLPAGLHASIQSLAKAFAAAPNAVPVPAATPAPVAPLVTPANVHES
jgi:flavin-dependent dehydrogenase